VCFFASDFSFKHAPSPYGFDDEWDCEPARLIQGPDIDIDPELRMQYFYVEDPYESTRAWSPLYVRTGLTEQG
jgi:hypothetical protein